jgi:Dockerin type I domain
LQASNAALTIRRLDVAALFSQAIANPTVFGLTNVTKAAAPGLAPGTSSYDMSKIAPNANQYMFWDDLHPTATVHAELAQFALVAVLLPGDFDRDGRVTSADIQAMLQSLTDLKTFQAENNLSAEDMLALGDINGDGRITNADIEPLLKLIANQNPGNGSTAAVPEPDSFGLLIVAGWGLIVARHVCRRCANEKAPRFSCWTTRSKMNGAGTVARSHLLGLTVNDEYGPKSVFGN